MTDVCKMWVFCCDSSNQKWTWVKLRIQEEKQFLASF